MEGPRIWRGFGDTVGGSVVGAVPGESKVKSSQVREPALGPWPRNSFAVIFAHM